MDSIASRLALAMAARKLKIPALVTPAGMTYQGLKKILDGKTASIKYDNLVALCRFLKINPDWLATGEGEMEPSDAIDVQARWVSEPLAIELENNPDYPAVRRVSVKAQAGITGYAVENCEDMPPIVFRADWYRTHNYRPERLMALRVAGHSMEPSLKPGDLIVVNTESIQPKDGVAFLVIYEGEAVVKRMLRDVGAWWLSSDHPDQHRYARKLCDERTQIIGEVVYKQSEHV